MLKVDRISGGYFNKTIIHNLSFECNRGEIIGILGPNGCGKTTLFKLLTRLLPLQDGKIYLDDKDNSSYSNKAFAKKVAVVPQSTDISFSYSVKEIVELGRYAHQKGFFPKLSGEDEQAINYAMKQTDLLDLSEMSFHQLSGGQKQRVMIAQCLAQQSELLLLDEPTNHLDLTYQKSILELIQQLAKKNNIAVIAILHDINLASLYCDKILLMDNKKNYFFDDTKNMITDKQLSNVFQTELVEVIHPKTGHKQFLLCKKNE